MSARSEAPSEAGALLRGAGEVAVQGEKGTLTPAAMATIGAEVGNIIGQMVVTGTASLRGQRLFGGELINADPFTASATG